MPSDVPVTPRQQALLDLLSDALASDSGVGGAWLAGSLGSGEGDAWSDLDLWSAARQGQAEAVAGRWPALAERVAPIVWRLARRVGGVTIFSQVTERWDRFDLTVAPREAAASRDPRGLIELFDRDRIAGDLGTGWHPPAPSVLPTLERVVPEFLRVMGLLPVVIHRQEYVAAMSGGTLLRQLLLDLLQADAGSARVGALRLRGALSPATLATVAGLPPLVAQRAEAISFHLACAAVFLPLARSLAARSGMPWPEAFERATRRRLRDTLQIELP